MACISPSLPLYAAEFLHDRKLRRLPAEVEVVVVRLWCLLWLEGPATREELLDEASSLRCTEATLDAALRSGLFVETGGKWRSERLEQERAERDSIRSAKSAAAKAGNRARWGGRGCESQVRVAGATRSSDSRVRSQQVIAPPTHPPTQGEEEEEGCTPGVRLPAPLPGNGSGASTAVPRARWGVPPKRKEPQA